MARDRDGVQKTDQIKVQGSNTRLSRGNARAGSESQAQEPETGLPDLRENPKARLLEQSKLGQET